MECSDMQGENCSESIFEVQCDYVQNNDDINSSQYSQVRATAT